VDHALRGERTLVISTDPAPSLGDALGLALGGSPRRVQLRRGILHAVEINPRQALQRWLRPRRSVLETIALRGTWLDESDVRQLLRLSLPGIDELAALLEMLRFGRSPTYDVIVVDTAPTGHTLRMLAMPATLSAVAHVFDDMQAKHRAMVAALRRSWIEDEADALIHELSTDAQVLAGLLRDRDATELTLVSLPEMLAVEETADAARSLVNSQIPVAHVVVNRVTLAPPQRCGWCEARRRFESGAIAALAARLDPLLKSAGLPVPSMAFVGAREREPVGVRALQQIAAELVEVEGRGLRVGQRAQRMAPRLPGSAARRFARVPVTRQTDRVVIPSARLLMFGGKGGVGKTTCAAAAALHLARTEPRRRVLLVSTDPAHSLADVLGAALSDTPRPVPGGPDNLRVRELDASRALESIRDQYAASIDALFDRLARGSSFEATHDRRVMQDLFDLAPPGLDELAAVLNLVELLDGGDTDQGARPFAALRGAPSDVEGPKAGAGFDAIVMDTAPTGHALRLLQMPEAVQDWTKVLMSILLKYQPVIGIGDIGVALLRLSRGLGRLRALLSNPEEAQFVVVTRAAALPRAETIRLLRSLRRLRVSVAAVVMNAAGTGTCSRCRSSERRERREIASLAAVTRRTGLMIAPAAVPPPVGSHALDAWRRKWRTVT